MLQNLCTKSTQKAQDFCFLRFHSVSLSNNHHDHNLNLIATVLSLMHNANYSRSIKNN